MGSDQSDIDAYADKNGSVDKAYKQAKKVAARINKLQRPLLKAYDLCGGWPDFAVERKYLNDSIKVLPIDISKYQDKGEAVKYLLEQKAYFVTSLANLYDSMSTFARVHGW